ncbi:Hsp70 family protein [Myxococcota bacterium]|nr:Hsp70 family protein [Myxococcota bacterium]
MRPDEIVLGIDLGTTFSSASAYIDGRVHYVLDARGDANVPSAVYFPRQGTPVVGADAERMRLLDPISTVHGVKRMLGCPADSATARLIEGTSAVRTFRLPDGSLGVRIHGRDHRPAELASRVIRFLKERAEHRFGKGIRRCFLTHPVNASKATRDATEQAARLAQLEVLGMVDEPSAGALAAGLGGDGAPKRFLVFDFGGGTLDVTVMEHLAERSFKVLAAGGDDLLGGDDFDQALARKISDVMWQARGVQMSHDVVLWERLSHRCEQAKRALSSAPEARLKVPELATGTGDIELRVAREDVETCWHALVERSIEIAAQVVVSAGLRPADLGALVPIGGTTFIPLVQRRLKSVFKLPSVQVADPQSVVAAGAALLGAKAAHLS